MPRQKKTSTRDDGRLPLTVYVSLKTIDDLKDASTGDEEERYA